VEKNYISNKKQELIAKNKEFEQNIAVEIDSLKQNAINIGKGALVVGGVVLVGYVLVRTIFSFFSSDDTPQKEEKIIYLPSESSTPVPIQEEKDYPFVVKMIISAITSFLLAIAKQKLVEFIEYLNKDSAENNTTTTA
jgi:hypothetical protein